MAEDNIHRALSSPMRRQIITFLASGRKYLTEIADHIHKTPQTVDFHLDILDNNGLISTSVEEGKRFYELKDKRILKFIDRHEPVPPGHRPKPPHEIVIEMRQEMEKRMDRIEEKLDRLLKKSKV